MSTKSTSSRVIALLLVSNEEQAADKRLRRLDRQQTVIDRIVATHNLEVIRTVTLINVSANNMLLNPECQAILQAIETHEVDGVVVSDLDRLVRLGELASLAAMDFLKRAKAKLYTRRAVHHFTSDEDISCTYMSAILADGFSQMMKKRMQHGKEAKRKAGLRP